MSDSDLADAVDGIVHEPTQSAVESTNVWSFMQEYDIDNYDELVERTTTDVEASNGVVHAIDAVLTTPTVDDLL